MAKFLWPVGDWIDEVPLHCYSPCVGLRVCRQARVIFSRLDRQFTFTCTCTLYPWVKRGTEWVKLQVKEQTKGPAQF